MSNLLELDKKQEFFPLQPEFANAMENYMEYKPKSTLSNDIALYYQFDAPKNAVNSTSIIPDAVFDLLFCCCESSHTSILWTSTTKRCGEFELPHTCKYFGVRILPRQNIIKFNCKMKEIIDQRIPLTDVVTISPSMIEEIAAASDFQERIKIFKKYLLKSSKKMDNQSDDQLKQEVFEYCISKIYSFKGNLSINDLVNDTGYSDRYIRNLFDERAGFSPKEFSEITRFHHALSMVLEEDERDMLDIAFDNGYHDQAHFIRSFKKYALMSPLAYKKFIAQY